MTRAWSAWPALPALLLLFGAAHSLADGGPPPSLEDLYEFEPSRELTAAFGEERRRAAMREAALVFGARGGLARRSWEIAGELERVGVQLSGVYRFGDLLVRHDGFMVMPPVVAETEGSFRLGRGGTRAATVRRVVRIVEGARIVSAVPGWRDFLIRSWPQAEAPVSVLFPRTDEESELWREWLADGWGRGVSLADEVFAADLDRLNTVFEGVVGWHRLRVARMVSAPVLSSEHVAVGGDGSGRLMRIDETIVGIEEPAHLNFEARDWRLLDPGEGK